jgi:ketosteroid isomerase-like protein
VLVNNAANFYAGFFEELSPEQMDRQLSTSLIGPMNVTRAILPVMRKQRSGPIITISSTAGLTGFEFGTAYAASKFGLKGWMQSLQAEVEPFGINTITVNPGFFRTEPPPRDSALKSGTSNLTHASSLFTGLRGMCQVLPISRRTQALNTSPRRSKQRDRKTRSQRNIRPMRSLEVSLGRKRHFEQKWVFCSTAAFEGACGPCFSQEPQAFKSRAGQTVLSLKYASLMTKQSWGLGVLVLIVSAVCLGQNGSKGKASSLRADAAGPAAREVLEIKRQYDEAQLRNDSAWFERMFAEDYVMVLPDSSTLTKARAVAELRSREITWKSATGEDMQVRVYGDTAVVTGRFLGKGLYKGKPLDEHQRFTSVWVKRDGRWQAITEHATDMPK